MKEEPQQSPALIRRALAILILAVIGWLLLKFVIGIIAGITTIIVVVLAVFAAIWAFRQL
jgi:hypothetical protein